jgi:hypothetical protein
MRVSNAGTASDFTLTTASFELTHRRTGRTHEIVGAVIHREGRTILSAATHAGSASTQQIDAASRLAVSGASLGAVAELVEQAAGRCSLADATDDDLVAAVAIEPIDHVLDELLHRVRVPDGMQSGAVERLQDALYGHLKQLGLVRPISGRRSANGHVGPGDLLTAKMVRLAGTIDLVVD